MLAGHSVGGTYALVYAARYPEQVAGVALIDSSTPYMFDLPDYPSFYSMWRRGSAMFPSLARTGLGRLTLATGSAGLPAQARDAARDFAASPRELRSDRNEFLMLPTVFEQAKELTSLNGKPLGRPDRRQGSQRGWTGRRTSSRNSRRTASTAPHAARHTPSCSKIAGSQRSPPRSSETSSRLPDDARRRRSPGHEKAPSRLLPPRPDDQLT